MIFQTRDQFEYIEIANIQLFLLAILETLFN